MFLVRSTGGAKSRLSDLLLPECRVKALLMIRHVSRFVRGYARHVTASFHPLCAREQQSLVLGVIADV